MRRDAIEVKPRRQFGRVSSASMESWRANERTATMMLKTERHSREERKEKNQNRPPKKTTFLL